MRIGLDARWVFRELSGIGVVTRELLREVPRLTPDDAFCVYFNQRAVLDRTIEETGVAGLSNVKPILLPYGLFAPGNQIRLPARLRADRVDVFHSTNYMIPLPAFSPRRDRRPACVVTLHDLIPLLRPQDTPRALKTRFHPLFRWLLNAVARRADAIITPSDSSRADVIAAFHLPPARQAAVHRVYNGVSPLFRAPSPDAARPAADPSRTRRLLYVGRADPYKNLPALVDAVAAARQRAPWPLELVILGSPDTRYPEAACRATAHGLGAAVRWTGYQDDASTVAAYREADLLVMPSRSEGFGLPVVEAMAAGLPALCNDIPVLREIAGDAAAFANAAAPAEFAAALVDLLANPVRLAALRAAGFRRAEDYSWRRAAEQTLAVYRAAAARLAAPA